MENDKPKRLLACDCHIDWKHVEVEELDGTTSIEDQSVDSEKILKSWIEEECTCNEFGPANLEKCYLYFLYTNNYDRHKFAEYAEQQHHTKQDVAFWGFSSMINDGWLKSPAFVNWRELDYCVSPFNASLKNLLMDISEPEKRVTLLSYLIKNVETIYGKWGKKEFILPLKDMLETHKAAATIRKQELAQHAAEERKKAKAAQKTPEYILSLEEIIDYAENESPDSASTIRAMLRYFAMEKPKWNNKALANKIRQIGQQVTVMGDYVQGDKIKTKVDSVAEGGIGIQENHKNG